MVIASSVAISGHGWTHPTPTVLDHGICADPKFFFWGGGIQDSREDGGRTRQQTCVEKHLT